MDYVKLFLGNSQLISFKPILHRGPCRSSSLRTWPTAGNEPYSCRCQL